MHPILAVIIVVVSVTAAAVHRAKYGRQRRNACPGWVYFIGSDEGPIKVGMTVRPVVERLAELQAHSPVRLKTYYKELMGDCRLGEKIIHQELDPYRLHGEWFDRDAALSLADHLMEYRIPS